MNNSLKNSLLVAFLVTLGVGVLSSIGIILTETTNPNALKLLATTWDVCFYSIFGLVLAAGVEKKILTNFTKPAIGILGVSFLLSIGQIWDWGSFEFFSKSHGSLSIIALALLHSALLWKVKGNSDIGNIAVQFTFAMIMIVTFMLILLISLK